MALRPWVPRFANIYDLIRLRWIEIELCRKKQRAVYEEIEEYASSVDVPVAKGDPHMQEYSAQLDALEDEERLLAQEMDILMEQAQFHDERRLTKE